MADIFQKLYVPTPVVPKATTPPPKVVSLKFKPTPGNRNDDQDMNFDFLELGFGYSDVDKSQRSDASQFLVEIRDLDTGIKKSYIQKADEYPYIYWQRSQEAITSEFIEEPEGGKVNARVTITPVNDMAQGNRSTFIMPMKDLHYVTPENSSSNNTTAVLAKFWNLFSRTPDDVKNRPKQMHIYIDVSEEEIRLDKESLFTEEWRYNTIGDYQSVNQEMYRWIVQPTAFQKINASDELVDMIPEEIIFIRYILNSFNDIYRRYVTGLHIGQSAPVVFKIAVQNPRDRDDNIIIYLMKGKRWEV